MSQRRYSLPVIALLLIASGSFSAAAQAQRLLTVSEGSAIAGTAQQYEGARRFTDCSHLVHRIFSSLGLEYDYATSNQLYGGAPDFERVRRPQPGDLIVWRGHVGVVVNPGERTFFSAVSSGMRTHSYDSPYWRSRGKPRFYRYVLPDEAPPQLIAAKAGSRAPSRAASPTARRAPTRSAGMRGRVASVAIGLARRHGRTSRVAGAAAILIRR